MLDLVSFVQFKKREKKRVKVLFLIKPATLLKVTPLHGYISRFLNCTNDTKSRNAYFIAISKIFVYWSVSLSFSLHQVFAWIFVNFKHISEMIPKPFVPILLRIFLLELNVNKSFCNAKEVVYKHLCKNF